MQSCLVCARDLSKKQELTQYRSVSRGYHKKQGDCMCVNSQMVWLRMQGSCSGDSSMSVEIYIELYDAVRLQEMLVSKALAGISTQLHAG